MRRKYRRAWGPLLCLVALLVLLAACRAKPGSGCDSEGEARCDGAGQMLICHGGGWQAVACGGPKGCAGSGRFVDCDESLARAGDPCGTDGVDAVACSADRSAMMRCDGKTWATHRQCRGPKHCAPSTRYMDCDDSLAEEGDSCDDGQRSCSVDGTKLLSCAKGRMAVESGCAPKRCRADDETADCD